MSRLENLSREQLNPAQIEVYNSISSGARGGVRGPFKVLLHSPELAKRVEQLGLYVRFQCKVPERLRELAINIVSYRWRASYEWYAHAPLAQKQGVPEHVLEAIGTGQRPDFTEDADAIVYEYVTELLETRQVSKPTFQRASALLGDQGLVDLTGLVGYYTLLALTINAFEVEIPEDANIPWSR
jgi:4-carboxymuconolactone decarboxylase